MDGLVRALCLSPLDRSLLSLGRSLLPRDRRAPPGARKGLWRRTPHRGRGRADSHRRPQASPRPGRAATRARRAGATQPPRGSASGQRRSASASGRGRRGAAS
jgi:hypothetical protein